MISGSLSLWHGMLCLQAAEEDCHPIWRVAANALNKQSQTADKGWSFSLGVGRGANNLSVKNFCVTKYSQLPVGWASPLVQASNGKGGTA